MNARKSPCQTFLIDWLPPRHPDGKTPMNIACNYWLNTGGNLLQESGSGPGGAGVALIIFDMSSCIAASASMRTSGE
jgi:hypothetical protein